MNFRSLNVVKMGEGGDPLFLLHGWGQNADALKRLGEVLASRFQVYLVDLPGFGDSPEPGEVWDTFEYARCLVGYLDYKGIEIIDIVGHSFGGKVAMSLAIRYPERVRRLGLIASAGLMPQRSYNSYLRSNVLKLLRWGVKTTDAWLNTAYFDTYYIPQFASPDYKTASPRMRTILVKSVNEDLTAQIVKIRSPTLIIWGEKDTETPPWMGRRLQSLITNSKLIVFPQKGHNLCVDTGGHLCGAYLLPFFLDSLVREVCWVSHEEAVHFSR